MDKPDKTLLKLHLEKLPRSPIKKTYDYYKHFGNSWNSKYLSSPKVSKYYIDPHQCYLSGPNGPNSISVLESTERTRLHEEKAAKSKIESRQRLVDRKAERFKIQAKAKQFLNISARRSFSPARRPNTQNFPLEKMNEMYKKLNTLNVVNLSESLEPVLLTEKNFSVNDSLRREHFERNDERLAFRNSFAKQVDVLRSGHRKITGDTDRMTRSRRFAASIDRNKVKEILEEIEEFEKEYARRLSLRPV